MGRARPSASHHAKHRKALFLALALRREADDRFLGRGDTLVDTEPVVISTRDVLLTEEARRLLQLPYCKSILTGPAELYYIRRTHFTKPRSLS